MFQLPALQLYTIVPHPVYTPTPQTWLINQLDAGANLLKEKNSQNSGIKIQLEKNEKFKSNLEKKIKDSDPAWKKIKNSDQAPQPPICLMQGKH